MSIQDNKNNKPRQQPHEDFINENNYRIKLNYNYLESNNTTTTTTTNNNHLSKASDFASKHSKYSNEIMGQQLHHQQNYSPNIGTQILFIYYFFRIL